MTIRKVTKERLESKDNFRGQINVNQFLWACTYNAMKGHFQKTEIMSYIRNSVAAELEQIACRHFTEQVESRPAFAEYLNHYLKEYIEPELQEDAKALWRSLGWEG